MTDRSCNTTSTPNALRAPQRPSSLRTHLLRFAYATALLFASHDTLRSPEFLPDTQPVSPLSVERDTTSLCICIDHTRYEIVGCILNGKRYAMNTEVLPGTTAVALIASIDISDAAITLHSSNDMGTVTFTDRSDDTLHSTFSSLVSAPNCKKNVFLSREMNYASSLTMKGSTAHSAAYWSGIDVPPLEGTASFILNKKPLASTIAIATIDP